MSASLPHFRSLRTRLALLYLFFFGLTLVVLCVVVMAVRERDLRDNFDDRMVDQSESMIESIQITADFDLEARSRPRLNPFRFPGYFFQIRLADGTIVEKSRNLSERELPFSQHSRNTLRGGGPVFETLEPRVAGPIVGRPAPLRLLTLHAEESSVQSSFYLQVGLSLERVEDSINSLRRLMLAIVPIGLIAAGIASWILARRALAPIAEVVSETRELTAEYIDRRIDVPPGQDEISELVITINGMLDRLQAAFQAQERFVANASHELQTPVSILLGEAQVLQRQQRDPEEYDRFVTSVQEEMRRLAQIVRSLLMLARADAGTPVPSDSVSINETLTDAIRSCLPLAHQRELRLVTRLALPDIETGEPRIRGDHSLLVTMVENIIRNAIRHSPVGQSVEAAVELNHGEARILVSDAGPGIPQEHVERIFDRFYQVTDSTRAYPGSGLGLTIAQGVARLHGGHIEARNLADSGCQFTITLPLHTDPSPQQVS